jgi:hypothetical protein
MRTRRRKPPARHRRLSDRVSAEIFRYSSTESNGPPPRFQDFQRLQIIGALWPDDA